MKKKKLKIDSVTKLALVNTFAGLVLAGILYFLLPYLLNYPENTIDNDFQVQMVGIKYSMQYLILVTILAILVFITFKLSYRKLSIDSKKIKDEKYVNAIRKRCFNYPYVTLIIQTLVPSIVCMLLLIVFKTNFELLMRICIVILSVSAIYSMLSYMINKKFFEEKLIKTSGLTSKQLSGVRLIIFKKLILQTFPLFLYTSVVMILISISVMTSEKGNLLYHFYREELTRNFSSNTTYYIEDVKNKLDTFNLNSPDDGIIMFSADNGEVYYTETDVNDFLINYTLRYYDVMDGHCFEYYGQNSQAALLRVKTNLGDYYVGVRFFVFSYNIYWPFFIVAIFTVLFNVFYIYYVGKSLSNDINNIVTGMSHISGSANVLIAHSLPITSNDEIGDLTLEFNKLQNLTKDHVAQIRSNQNMLMEKERLASLGQMIGGISHNLKTPIMSISGATEGLSDLIREYESSIGDPEVTNEDHHAIASDMKVWIDKIHSYTSYMSDIITAVKGQAVNLSENESEVFTVDELLKRVNILIKHELQNASVKLVNKLNAPSSTSLHGDVNSLVQVIINLITNAIQSYNGKKDESIILSTKIEKNNLVISVADKGCGIPKDVQDRLFKSMITTKGKKGTGLGMFMSYSTIKGHFNGDITFKSEVNKGTTFNIILPL